MEACLLRLLDLVVRNSNLAHDGADASVCKRIHGRSTLNNESTADPGKPDPGWQNPPHLRGSMVYGKEH